MYIGIKHLHSFLPYILLSLLLLSVIVFALKGRSNSTFTKGDKMLALFTLIFAHLQGTAGFILYFISPMTQAAFENSSEIMSDPVYRFYAVEHIATMVLALFFVTFGYSRSKKIDDAKKKFKTLTTFYLLTLLAALSRIPWDTWLS